MRRVLCIFILAVSLRSQEFRGTIRGRILDPSGAAVVGATVEVIHAETNVKTTAASNEAGNYQVPFLLPGNYTVRVEHPGFKTLERQGVRVSLNELVTLDLTLELGQATESVTVTAAAPLLNTASADLGQVIERTFVETMVVSLSRNVMNLRNLAPGVTGGTGTYTSSAQGEFSIAGGGTRGDNEIVVDGIPSTTVDGTIGFVPALDAVEEVKVHTTMFDAAYGHSNGGAVTITTRGGGNELHGSAFLYKRWAALNANSWTNNRLGLPKPPVTYRQWGYAFSGPLYLPRVYDGRNRTFFSTTLERDHDARELTRQARVPTEAERKGDFSKTLNRLGGPFAIYDPATTVVEGTRATRQPFPGAVIPPSRISPIGAAVLGKYPLPNQPAPTQIAGYNWGLSKTYSVDQHQYSGRVDHAIGDRQRLFVRLGVLDRIQMAEELIFGATSFPVSGGSDLDRPLARRRFSLAVDDTLVVSPNLVGSIRLGVLSYSSRSQTGAAGADPRELNIADIIVSNQAFRGWPNFSPGENLPDLGSTKSFSRQLTNSVVSTWTRLSGEHALKFGVDYRLGRINSVSPGSNAVGSFTFNPTFTHANPFEARSADSSGSGMASLLLGLAASGNFGYNTATSTQNHHWAWFFQDDWKVTRRLTLNLGVRYELETPFTERYDRMGLRFDENARLPVQVPGMELRAGFSLRV
ncbi:MAG: TonB-dependent receptor [Bryobacterales bacterium]|nr:TonB-dependent receptor [Bryobacterales bacterium]